MKWEVWFMKDGDEQESFLHVVKRKKLPCVPVPGDEVYGDFLPPGFVKAKVTGRKISFKQRRVTVLLEAIPE